MDATLLARIQFGVTVGFHFIFPQITIGMAWILFWMMAKWVRTGQPLYKRMARFWTHIFALVFAIGVATGIVMEFQFGTNWADYSRYVGDIFGAPLAAEGVIAFFLESTFLGMLLFGWKKLSPKVHLFSAGMVAFGSTLSAFWIIAANSWQQTPAGFKVVGSRAEMTDFVAAVFNPSTMIRYLHTVDGALIAASAQFILGHHHAVQVYKTQPLKLAAFEGHFESSANAPLLAFGIPDADAGKTHLAVSLPGMLSFGLTGDFNTVIKGLNEWPREEWPPLPLTFFPFHIMVALWVLLMLVTVWGTVLLYRKKLPNNIWYQRLALYAVPAPILASTLGWMTAEIGRQPWIVYGLLKTSDAVSKSVAAGEILFSLLFLSLIYLLLFGVWIFLIRHWLHKGPETDEQMAGKGVAS